MLATCAARRSRLSAECVHTRRNNGKQRWRSTGEGQGRAALRAVDCQSRGRSGGAVGRTFAASIAAAEAGKMVLCEKPLARTAEESQPMVDAVEKSGVANTVWYNYRRVPAVTLAKQIVESGKLGQIFHYRANFLQDWTISADLPQGGEGLWRLDAAAAGRSAAVESSPARREGARVHTPA